MYKLEYLPVARQDLVEIVSYISKQLRNPGAAASLAAKFLEAGERIAQAPYTYPAYRPLRALQHEYRKCLVGNYLMFYWVDEAAQTVTVARVIYARRDYESFME